MPYKLKGKSPRNFKHRHGMTNFAKTLVWPCGEWEDGGLETSQQAVSQSRWQMTVMRTKSLEMAVERWTNGEGDGDTVFLQSRDAI